MKIDKNLYLVSFSLLLLTACGSRYVPNKNLPLAGKVDEYFTYLKEEKDFHGVVLIYKEGKVLINKG